MTKYFYALDPNQGEYPLYWIVEQNFWNKHGKCDDCFDDCPELAYGFGYSMESAWEFYGLVVQAEYFFEDSEFFERNPEFSDFINNGDF